jgi:O-antigen ligase
MELGLLALTVFLILRTGSRASILWVSVSALTFWVVRRGMGLAFLLAVAAIFIYAVWAENLGQLMRAYWKYRSALRSAPLQMDLLSGRDELWRLAVNLWKQRPWFGFGPGSDTRLIAENSSLLANSQGLHFHNSYLGSLVESGLVGLAGLVLAFVIAIAAGGGNLRKKPDVSGGSSISWPHVTVLALVLGAMCHGYFESWLLNGGNANTLIFWTALFSLSAPRPETSYRRVPLQLGELREGRRHNSARGRR